MGKIMVYNSHLENHENEKNNFYIGRSRNGNPLGNPFTYEGKKSDIARFVVNTREESIEKYKEYFREMYGKDNELTRAFNEIYEPITNPDNLHSLYTFFLSSFILVYPYPKIIWNSKSKTFFKRENGITGKPLISFRVIKASSFVKPSNLSFFSIRI
jgi:hypothetical protein